MAFRKFKFGWKLKAATLNFLGVAPFGGTLYYLLQRYVTKTIPRRLAPTEETGAAQISHARKFLQCGIHLDEATLFEFGAGWDLYSNIILYCFGANRQITIDIRRLVKAEAINAVIRHLQADPPQGAIRTPPALIRQSHLEEDLRDLYGIIYRAPDDATALDFADDSIDLIATTSVLEHVPDDIVQGIMRECYRILRRGGLMSHVIDYSDHYAHSDPAITEFNYLAFDEKAWARYSPGIHFQNRRRSSYFRRVFEKYGFVVRETDPWHGEAEALEKVPVNPQFKQYPRAELLELGCHFLLEKPA
ncbi:MAG TPA: methyltransferase domain-containing protein [Terriglobales bacterium]|nr:methyltransferase domain-containing protein [Terriglobales bacterium]